MNYTDVHEDMRKLLDNILSNPNEKSYEYNGVDVTTNSILKCNPNIKDNLSDMEYHTDQGRDALDVFIHSVYLLGFEVGERYEKERK